MRVPYKMYITTAFLISSLWFLNSIKFLRIFFPPGKLSKRGNEDRTEVSDRLREFT